MKEIYKKLTDEEINTLKAQHKELKFDLRIEEWRTKKGLSQKQFAEILGMKQSYLSNIENNKIKPNLETLILISQILSTDINLLLNLRNTPDAKTEKIVNVDIKTAIMLEELKKIPEDYREPLIKMISQTAREFSNISNKRERRR